MLSLHKARKYLVTHSAIVTGGQTDRWAALGKDTTTKYYISVAFGSEWETGLSHDEKWGFDSSSILSLATFLLYLCKQSSLPVLNVCCL